MKVTLVIGTKMIELTDITVICIDPDNGEKIDQIEKVSGSLLGKAKQFDTRIERVSFVTIKEK